MINRDESRDDNNDDDDEICIENPTLSPYDRVLREEAPSTLPGLDLGSWESQSVDSPVEPTFVSRTMRSFVAIHDKCVFLPRYLVLNAPPWTLFLGKSVILCAFGALLAYLAYKKVSFILGILFCIKLVTLASSFLISKLARLQEALSIFLVVSKLLLNGTFAFLFWKTENSTADFLLRRESLNIILSCILLFFITEFPKSIRPLQVFYLLVLNLLAAIFFQRCFAGQMLIQSLGWSLEQLVHYADAGSLWTFGGADGDSSSFFSSVFSTHILFSAILKVFHAYRTFDFLLQFLALPLSSFSGIAYSNCRIFLASFFFSDLESESQLGRSGPQRFAKLASDLATIPLSLLVVFVKMGISSSSLVHCFLMSLFANALANNFILPQSRKQAKSRLSQKKSSLSPKPVIEELLDGACASLHSSLTLAAVAFATIPARELFKYLTNFVYGLVSDSEKLDLPELDAMDLLGALFSPICAATGVTNGERGFCGKLGASSLIFGNLISFQILAEGRSFREDGHPKCDCDANTQWPSERTELVITSLLLGSYFLGQAFLTAKNEKRKFRRSAFFVAIVAVFLRTNLISLMFAPSGSFMWGEENFQTANCSFHSATDENTTDLFALNSCKITCDGMSFDRVSKIRSRCSIYSDYAPITRNDVPQEVIEYLAQAEAKELKKKNLKELKIGKIGNLSDNFENFAAQSSSSEFDALDILSVNNALKFLNSDEPELAKNASPDSSVVCVSLLDDCELADDSSPFLLLPLEPTVTTGAAGATVAPGIETDSNLPE